MTTTSPHHTGDRWLKIWLQELQSAQPNVVRSAQAARQLAKQLHDSPAMRQWLAALNGLEMDRLSCDACQALLPDFLYAQQHPDAGEAPTSPRFAEVRAHLAHCPYCAEAYSQVAEWLQASEADRIDVATDPPHFDLSFLPDDVIDHAAADALEAASNEDAISPWLVEKMKQAMAAGKSWVGDAAGNLYLWLGTGLQTEPTAGWALKSAEPGARLAHAIFSGEAPGRDTEDEIAEWEIEISAVADDEIETECHVEVALYPVGGQRELAGIVVMLHYGATVQRMLTDAGGVAVFTGVPIGALDQVIVQAGVGAQPRN